MARYHAAKRIAYGGMAEVLLAAQRGPGGFEKLLVLKRILPQYQTDQYFIDMFLAEARLAASLRHPNIVEIYDVHWGEEGVEILMEYLPGPDLRQVLDATAEAGQFLPPAMCCHIVAKVADALHCAHTATGPDRQPMCIVHRDVSPSNVMLTRDGYVKVVDFGVAKAEGLGRFTKTGAVKGKLLYASPEQVNGGPLGAASDLFSLGVVLYELLTGVQLFAGPTQVAIVYNIMEREITAPRHLVVGIPPALDALVMALLEREPERRPGSAAAVRDRLEALERELGGSGHRAIAAWLGASMAAHFQQRRALEHDVVTTGRDSGALVQAVAPAPSGPALAPGALAEASEPSMHAPHAHGQAPSQRHALVASGRPVWWRRPGLWVMGALFAGIAAAVVVGLSSSPGLEGQAPLPAAAAVADASTQPDEANSDDRPATVALHLFVAPAGAEVSVNGAQLAETVGPHGLLVPVPAEAQVRLMVSKLGFRAHEATLLAPGAGTMPVYVTLTEASADAEASALAGDSVAVAVAAEADDPADRAGADPPADGDAATRKPAERTGRRRDPPRRSRARGGRSGKAATGKSARASAGEAAGTLRVDYVPANASLRVDGVVRAGGSPQTLTLAPGPHTLQLDAAGYVSEGRSVTVTAGDTTRLSMTLARERRVPDATPRAQAPPPRAPVSVRADEVTKLSGTLPTVTLRREQVGTQAPTRTKPISARLCIDERGAVSSVVLTKSVIPKMTGPIEKALRSWRYRPYRRGGEAVPACFALSFALDIVLR